MSKLVAIDLETTGLDPNPYVILGIGAVVFDSTGYNVIDELSLLINPGKAAFDLASPEALQVNGLTWDKVSAEGIAPRDATNEFLKFLYPHMPAKYIGQNPNFDIKFMRYFMEQELDFIGFQWAATDIRGLYDKAVALRKVPRLQKKSGKNISMSLGVPPEPDVHDALEGARVVYRNYVALQHLLNSHK